MESVMVQVKKLSHYDESFDLPKLETPGSAGVDIKACFEDKGEMIIKPFERVLVPTGLSVAIPKGYEIQVRPRSGLSFKTGLMVPNSPGTIDSDYRGELKVLLVNLGPTNEVVEHGMRVAQLLICPTWRIKWDEVEELESTDRGAGGFGSTGVKNS